MQQRHGSALVDLTTPIRRPRGARRAGAQPTYAAAPRTQRISRFYHAGNLRPARRVYIQLPGSAPLLDERFAPSYQLLTKTGERFQSLRHARGLSCRLNCFCLQNQPQRRGMENAFRARRMRTCSALSDGCSFRPFLVAEAPHKVASGLGAGIFLSLQGNDMAKCQRTKLDTARSLYSAFCSAGMLYSEQCMTCLRLQARSKPAVISISRGEI